MPHFARFVVWTLLALAVAIAGARSLLHTATAQQSDEMTIKFGTAAPSVVIGSCTTLRWSVGNARSVMLDGVQVSPNGSRSVCPTQRTTFTLSWRRADNASGHQEATVWVTDDPVAPPAPDGALVAYHVPAGVIGNQPHAGPLGMEFDVARAIRVTHLGAFDSGQDGLRQAIDVAIYDRSTQKSLARLILVGSDSTLVGGSRFDALPQPLVLPAGFRGAIVAAGYGTAEPNGNGIGNAVFWSVEDTDLIRFVGDARWGYPCRADVPGFAPSCRDGYPLLIDGGPNNRYAAGTFMFEKAP